MSRPHLESFVCQYPIGSKVVYSNHGKKGHGNKASISDILVSINNPQKIAAIQLNFSGGGNHYVSPRQFQNHYKLIIS